MATNPGTRGKKMVAVDSGTAPKINPPAELTTSAKKIWKRLVDSMPNDHFVPSDFPLLAAYCSSYELMIKAQSVLDKEGIMAEDNGGRLQRSPWFMIHQQATNKIASMASKLRLSPAVRKESGRVSAATVYTKTSKLSSLLKK